MRMKIGVAVGTLCWLLLAVAGYAAPDADHGKALAEHYRLEKPDGAGPFPTVVMVPRI